MEIQHGNTISFSVSKISFIFLMARIDSTNNRNIVTVERPELKLPLYIFMSNISVQLC